MPGLLQSRNKEADPDKLNARLEVCPLLFILDVSYCFGNESISLRYLIIGGTML
jgi:hypothetical protein